MRVAIFSDIHGECYPFDHVLRDIRKQGIDQLVCLGDALQGGSKPAETLARLRELACPVVMGNADAWLISGKETSTNEKTNEKQKEMREWSLSKLSKSDLDFIRSFLPTAEIELEQGKKLLCFHGSPRSFDDVILPSTPDETVRLLFLGNNATFFAGGHTHTQQIRRLGDSWYINPGSVSLAYNWEHSNVEKGITSVDPWADYAIISSEGNNLGVTFRHVPYDVEELGSIIRKSGRPHAEDVISEYRRK
jgi:putative phosphoesterase